MTVIPLFPPGVHDIVSNDIGDGLTEFVCSAGDYVGAVAHTDKPEEMRMAFGATVSAHAVKYRRRLCHEACVDEPECLYDGEVT